MLNLLVLYSSQTDALVAFYERLGLTFTKHRHGSGPEHFASESESGFVFEIYPVKDGDIATRTRLGFRVPSVDDCIAALVTSDVTVVSKPRESEWGRRAVVSDPDGNRIELIEAPKLIQE